MILCEGGLRGEGLQARVRFGCEFLRFDRSGRRWADARAGFIRRNAGAENEGDEGEAKKAHEFLGGYHGVECRDGAIGGLVMAAEDGEGGFYLLSCSFLVGEKLS